MKYYYRIKKGALTSIIVIFILSFVCTATEVYGMMGTFLDAAKAGKTDELNQNIRQWNEHQLEQRQVAEEQNPDATTASVLDIIQEKENQDTTAPTAQPSDSEAASGNVYYTEQYTITIPSTLYAGYRQFVFKWKRSQYQYSNNPSF